MRTPVTGTSANGAAAPTAAANAGTSRRPAAAAHGDDPRAPERDQREQRPQRRKPDVHQPPPPPRIRPERPRLEARPTTSAPAPGPRPQARSPRSGATLRPASVSMKKRTRRPFSVRNQPSASARLTTRWRAASPSLSSGSAAPGRLPRPAPAQHRARAGVAAGVGGDVQQPGRPEHRRAPRPPRRCAPPPARAPAGWRRRTRRRPRWSPRAATAARIGSPAERPRSTISVPGGAQANGLRAARAACAGANTPTAVIEGRKSPAPGRHGREVNTSPSLRAAGAVRDACETIVAHRAARGATTG